MKRRRAYFTIAKLTELQRSPCEPFVRPPTPVVTEAEVLRLAERIPGFGELHWSGERWYGDTQIRYIVEDGRLYVVWRDVTRLGGGGFLRLEQSYLSLKGEPTFRKILLINPKKKPGINAAYCCKCVQLSTLLEAFAGRPDGHWVERGQTFRSWLMAVFAPIMDPYGSARADEGDKSFNQHLINLLSAQAPKPRVPVVVLSHDAAGVVSEDSPPSLSFPRADGSGDITFVFDEEAKTIWASQKDLSEIFGVSVPTINYHIAKILRDGELDNSVIEKILIPASDGKRYTIQHYSLKMLIAVANKVDSEPAVSFRAWSHDLIERHVLVVSGLVEVVEAAPLARMRDDLDPSVQLSADVMELEFADGRKFRFRCDANPDLVRSFLDVISR